MLAARFALALFAFLASFLAVFALPVVESAESEVATNHLEKRITHWGIGTCKCTMITQSLDRDKLTLFINTDYYTGMGNCGWVNYDHELVLAMPKDMYDKNGGSNCGQWVKITATINGITKTAWGQMVNISFNN
jgi:hypothetical protein